MVEKGVINRFQLWLLITNFLIGSALVFTPTKVVSAAEQDGWLSIIFMTIIGFFFILFTLTLIHRHNNLTIVGIAKQLLGKPLGMVIGLLFAWFYLHLAAILLREIGDMIKLSILNVTPLFFLIFTISLVIYYLTYNGLEVIVRSNEILSPMAIFSFWLTILMVIPLLEPVKILPVLTEGIKPVLQGTFQIVGFTYGEFAIFLMIIPFANSQKNMFKVISYSAIVAGTTLLVTVLSSIMVLDVSLIELSISAPFSMARLISVGNFLRGFEILIALSYILTILIKMTASFYAGVLAIAQVFELSDYRPIIFPISVSSLFLAMLVSEDIVEFMDYTSTAWAPYALTFSLVIPLLLLAISYIKSFFKKK